MLPIMGVVYRWVAFSFGDPLVPGFVAAKLQIVDLAVVALTEVLPIPALLALALVVPMRIMPMPTSYRLPDDEHRNRNRNRAIIVTVFSVLVALVLTALAVVTGEVAYPITLFALALGWYLSTGAFILWYRDLPQPVPFARLVPVAAAITVAIGILVGLAPTRAGTTVADLETVAGSALPSARYVLLGEADGFVWLLPCDDQTAAIQVPANSLALRKVVESPSGLLSLFSEVATFDILDPQGFVPGCE